MPTALPRSWRWRSRHQKESRQKIINCFILFWLSVMPLKSRYRYLATQIFFLKIRHSWVSEQNVFPLLFLSTPSHDFRLSLLRFHVSEFFLMSTFTQKIEALKEMKIEPFLSVQCLERFPWCGWEIPGEMRQGRFLLAISLATMAVMKPREVLGPFENVSCPNLNKNPTDRAGQRYENCWKSENKNFGGPATQ